MSALSILVDTSQPRLLADGLSTLVAGRDWDTASVSSTWIDPITNTLMLEPNAINAGYTNSTSGVYSKYSQSDFTLTPSSGYVASNGVDQGGPFIQLQGANSAGVKGIGPVKPVNQPMVIEYFNDAGTPSTIGICECGWSNTGDGSVGVSLRFYNDGRAEVWKTGVKQATYNMSGGYDYFNPLTGQVGKKPSNGYTRLMLIPCRDRELLVVSSEGAGFSHVFDDLPEAVTGQTITNNAAFWYRTPPPHTSIVRIARLQYTASSGTILGKPSGWRATPSGSQHTQCFQALTQAALNLAAVSTQTPAANPLSIPNPIQIKLTLTRGSTTSISPFVYGARAWYDPTTANTASVNTDALPFALSGSLDVPDNIGGTRFHVQFHSPAAMATAGIPGIAKQCNRPYLVSDQSGTILTGVGEAPHFTDSHGFTDAGLDSNQDIDVSIRDIWKFVEEFVFEDPIPLDGLSLEDAYSEIV